MDHKAVRIDMPEPNFFVRFHYGKYQFKVPFTIYVDFQAILQSLKDETVVSLEAPYTREINHHIPFAFCTYTTFAYRKVDHLLKLYQGNDCMEVFCDHLKEEAKRLHQMFPPKPMEPITLEQWGEFIRVRECHICLKHFKPWDKKMRDHCHYTGKYRGATHQKCNFHSTIPNYIPVVFHNSGYDIHLFIREVGKKFDSGSISMITKNKQKYISFNVSIITDEREMSLSEIKQIMREL